MSTLRRRVAAGVALLACALPLGVAQAQDDGHAREKDNIAVATTQVDGSRVFDFSWSLRRQRGGVVDHRNIANAAARCTNCRATAIAFQIVLASGSPSEITPYNQSLAINHECTNCVVYAGARQFVRVTSGYADFTDEGRAILNDVRNDLRALEEQDLGVDALIAEVEKQEARVLNVLTKEVVTTSGDPVTVRYRENLQDNDGS